MFSKQIADINQKKNIIYTILVFFWWIVSNNTRKTWQSKKPSSWRQTKQLTLCKMTFSCPGFFATHVSRAGGEIPYTGERLQSHKCLN